MPFSLHESHCSALSLLMGNSCGSKEVMLLSPGVTMYDILHIGHSLVGKSHLSKTVTLNVILWYAGNILQYIVGLVNWEYLIFDLGIMTLDWMRYLSKHWLKSIQIWYAESGWLDLWPLHTDLELATGNICLSNISRIMLLLL